MLMILPLPRSTMSVPNTCIIWKVPITKMGKKLVAARALPTGHVLLREDICLKSPGDGLPPYELDTVIGQTLLQPVNEDDEFSFQIMTKTPEFAR